MHAMTITGDKNNLSIHLLDNSQKTVDHGATLTPTPPPSPLGVVGGEVGDGSSPYSWKEMLKEAFKEEAIDFFFNLIKETYLRMAWLEPNVMVLKSLEIILIIILFYYMLSILFAYFDEKKL